MIRLPFWKVQSIGNDFPLFHLDDIVHAKEFLKHELSDPVRIPSSAPPQIVAGCEVDVIDTPAMQGAPHVDGFLSALAIASSDRKFGIGGDGLLVLGKEDGDLRLRMFNPDGTEDFCGNGLRCAAWHAYVLGWVGKTFAIRHIDERVEVEILGEGKVRTLLGRAEYTPDHVPVRTADGKELFDGPVWGAYRGSALTTGSTHTIIWNGDPSSPAFEEDSVKIETDPRFPQRTSVIWAHEEGPNRLRIRIWERGAGETQGCGTGSSAAAADYLRRARRGGSVEVINPGGSVVVSMDAWDAPITVEGVAEEVFHGEYLYEAALI